MSVFYILTVDFLKKLNWSLLTFLRTFFCINFTYDTFDVFIASAKTCWTFFTKISWIWKIFFIVACTFATFTFTMARTNFVFIWIRFASFILRAAFAWIALPISFAMTYTTGTIAMIFSWTNSVRSFLAWKIVTFAEISINIFLTIWAFLAQAFSTRTFSTTRTRFIFYLFILNTFHWIDWIRNVSKTFTVAAKKSIKTLTLAAFKSSMIGAACRVDFASFKNFGLTVAEAGIVQLNFRRRFACTRWINFECCFIYFARRRLDFHIES